MQLSNSISNCNSGPKSVQELAVLQATLFSLQQQQLLQMQILSQMSRGKESDAAAADPPITEADPPAAAAASDGAAVAATRVMAELAKKMQLAPTFEEKKQGWIFQSNFLTQYLPKYNFDHTTFLFFLEIYPS